MDSKSGGIRSLSLEGEAFRKKLDKRFLGENNPRQMSCPSNLTRQRINNNNVGHCQVHCPGGENRSESFDYFAHPTERSSLVQLSRPELLPKKEKEDSLLHRAIEEEEKSADAEPVEEGFMLEQVQPEDKYRDELTLVALLKMWLKFWKTALIVLVPIIFLPVLLQAEEEEKTKSAFRCAYVMLIMASFWVTEALPLAITSLIPVALLPVFGIMTTDDVGRQYLKETNLMFISGLIMAIAVEHSNLHKRIAIRFMLAVGTGPRRLMLGFMLPTMFLSMWMSNTATTAMMVPIVDAVIAVIEKDLESEQGSASNKKKHANSIRVMMFLSIAYAANTGGTGTLTGTGANLVLKGMMASSFRTSPVNFASFSLFAAPLMLVNTLLCWVWLQCWFMGFASPFRAFADWRRNRHRKGSDRKANVKQVLRKKCDELGPITFHELAVLILFVLLIFLWVFRDPKFIKGWGNFVTVDKVDYKLSNQSCVSNCTYDRIVRSKDSIDDATAGMIVVIMLFILPAKPNFWPFNKKGISSSSPSPAMLQWSVVQSRMPWSIVLLLGGGFALAKATDVSGLSSWLGSQLQVLDFLDRRLLLLIVCAFTAAATEVTSNVATCSILLPVLRDLSFSLQINPLYLMLPATLTCSYAFMLPVATAPNAIVYSASGMNTLDMVKCGFFFNLICISMNMVCVNSYGSILFGLDEFPDWAREAQAAASIK